VGYRPNEDQDYWVTENSPTVIPKVDQSCGRKPNLTPAAISGDQSILVLSLNRFTCLASYAVSLQGAARIIYDQQIASDGAPIDLALAAVCKRITYGYNSCLAAYPMITGTHQPAGDPTKYSDRTNIKGASLHKAAVSCIQLYCVLPSTKSGHSSQRRVSCQGSIPTDRSIIKEIDT